MSTSRTTLALLVGLAITRVAYADVSWTPVKLTHTAIAGTLSWQEISFVSDSPETGAALRVVPELAPYVRLSAAGFTAVEAGRSYRVIAFVTLPLDMAPGLRTGTIQVVSTDGSNRTLARPLPVELRVQRPSLTTIPTQLASPSLDRIRSEDVVTYVAREIEIFFRPGTNLTEIRRVAGSIGGTFLGSLSAERMYQIAVPQVTFEELHQLGIRLEAIPSVELAVPNLALKSFALPGEGITNGQRLINLDRAWDITTGAKRTADECRNNAWFEKGPCLGIVDNFFDTGHADLRNNIADLFQPADTDTLGLLSLNYLIHGTAVASVAGGRANNERGAAGVMWDTNLLLYANGQISPIVIGGQLIPLPFITDTSDAVSRALDAGVRVLNLSQGQTCGDDRVCTDTESGALDAFDRWFTRVADRALSRNLEVVWVFAAGNEGDTVEHTSPARLAASRADVISVAAVNDTAVLLATSNRGLVSLAAPGANVRAALAGGDWFTPSGTSVAAPFVTGVAGLMLSRNPGLDAASLKEKLVSSSNPGPEGIPLLDACRAVKAAKNEDDPSAPPLVSPGPGEIIQLQNGSVTLRWGDAPSCNLVVSYEITLTGGGTTATNGTHYLNPNYLETSFPMSQPGSYTWQVVAIDRYNRRGPAVTRSFSVAPPVSTPLITLITPSAVVGGTFDVTITGTGFDAAGAVDQVYQPDGSFMGQGTILSRSTTEIVVREFMAGAAPFLQPYIVKVRNPNGQLSNGALLTLNDEVSVLPGSGVAGTVFTYTGHGFTGSFGVTSHLKRPDGTEFSTLQIATSSTGTFGTTINSAGFSAGTYEVWAVDNNTTKSSPHVTVQVLAPLSARTFAKMYAPPGGFADGSAGHVMPNGDIIVVATHYDPSLLANKPLIARFQSDGNVLWARTLDLTAPFGIDSHIVATNDGGFVVLSMVNLDTFLLRFDGSGNLVWQKRVVSARLLSLERTSDGGYLASGSDRAAFPLTAGLLIKFNAVGVMEWQRRISGAFEFRARQRLDSGYVVVGNGLDGRTIVILRFGADGQLESQSAYRDSSGFLSMEDLQPTADGGVVMVGGLDIIKLDSVGNLEWRRRVTLGVGSYQPSIRQTLDGGYVLGAIANPTGAFDAAGIAKLDGAGNVMWAKALGRAQTTADAILETPDGGYLAVGDADTNNYILLLKVDAAGQIPGCGLLVDMPSATQPASTVQVTSPGTVVASSVAVDDVSVLPLPVSLAASTLCISP